jgi:hypothetical protein
MRADIINGKAPIIDTKDRYALALYFKDAAFALRKILKVSHKHIPFFGTHRFTLLHVDKRRNATVSMRP